MKNSTTREPLAQFVRGKAYKTSLKARNFVAILVFFIRCFEGHISKKCEIRSCTTKMYAYGIIYGVCKPEPYFSYGSDVNKTARLFDFVRRFLLKLKYLELYERYTYGLIRPIQCRLKRSLQNQTSQKIVLSVSLALVGKNSKKMLTTSIKAHNLAIVVSVTLMIIKSVDRRNLPLLSTIAVADNVDTPQVLQLMIDVQFLYSFYRLTIVFLKQSTC